MYAHAFKLFALCATISLAACGDAPEQSPDALAAERVAPLSAEGGASVPENSGGTVFDAGSGGGGRTMSFTLSGGADRERFTISATGELRFVEAPDFEDPLDADGDNLYEVEIAANDGERVSRRMVRLAVANVGPDGFRVRRVAQGLDGAVFLAPVPDGTGRVFVVRRGGLIQILDPATGAVAAPAFLDVEAEISTQGERGLLGFATSPGFASNRIFFVFLTNPNGDIEIRSYRTFRDDRNRANPASMDIIMTYPHPAFSHYGGWIGFDAQGKLYIAMGDGGGVGDPNNQAQNVNRPYGKILRIVPHGDDFPADPLRDYMIPPRNPFAQGGGLPEVWAYGLRNPFRCSIDLVTGRLYIGDVGQNAIEEISLLRRGDAGINFGWPLFEGTEPYDGGDPAGLTMPVAQYGHGEGPIRGRSVTGGIVYRGPVESLHGRYFFADFLSDNIWSLPSAAMRPGRTRLGNTFTRHRDDFAPDAGAINRVTAFGEDEAGNMYLVGIDGEIFRVELQ